VEERSSTARAGDPGFFTTVSPVSFLEMKSLGSRLSLGCSVTVICAIENHRHARVDAVARITLRNTYMQNTYMPTFIFFDDLSSSFDAVQPIVSSNAGVTLVFVAVAACSGGRGGHISLDRAV